MSQAETKGNGVRSCATDQGTYTLAAAHAERLRDSIPWSVSSLLRHPQRSGGPSQRALLWPLLQACHVAKILEGTTRQKNRFVIKINLVVRCEYIKNRKLGRIEMVTWNIPNTNSALKTITRQMPFPRRHCSKCSNNILIINWLDYLLLIVTCNTWLEPFIIDLATQFAPC
jgi:hypothetical protein